MKYKIILVLLVLTFCSLTIGQTRALTKVGGNNIFTGEHPYLFYTKSHINELQEKIKTDTASNRQWQNILELLNNNNLNGELGAVENLGLAYLMTGKAKYAKKLKDILFRYCTKKEWEEANLHNREPSWNAGLLLAKITRTVAVGYDCIYDYLSPQEREFIVDNLVKKGILPTLNDWLIGPKRIHSLDSMGHNWWSVCVYNAGIAVLAILNDEPKASEWLKEIISSIPQWINYQGTVLGHKPANFDKEGGFYESVNYAAFAISALLKFRLAYINTFPESNFIAIPELENMDKFFINSCYPNSGELRSINFGDGHFGPDKENPVVLLMANGFNKERYSWYLAQNDEGQKTAQNGFSNDRFSPAFDLVYSPEINKKAVSDNPGLPLSTLYPDMGWAMLRNSWDKNATLLTIISGFTFNHAHADAGSFMIYHNGKNLICDAGNSSYDKPEYTRYFCQSEAHNVVLFNGKGENPEDRYTGSNNPGKLHSLLDAGDIKYIYANASGPYARYLMRNFRHFIWIGNTILVIDDLKSYEPGQFEWLLHYNGIPTVSGQDINIVDEDARVIVRPLFPGTFQTPGSENSGKLILQVKEGPSPKTTNPPIPYYSILNPSQERVTKFITAFLLSDKEHPEKFPQTETFEGENMLGVKIREDDKITYIYYNLMADGRIMHEPSINIFDGWETDASLVAVTYPKDTDPNDMDNIIDIMVIDGSYLRKDGKQVMSSLSKVFLIARNEEEALNLFLDGQPIIDLRLKTPKKPSTTMLNNHPVEINYNESSNMVQLSITKE